LNEVGFNRHRIEKWPANEEGCSSRSVYNRAKYAGYAATCWKRAAALQSAGHTPASMTMVWPVMSAKPLGGMVS